MQVLKEEVRNRILKSAEDVFYHKDYRSARLSDIAQKANLPVSLVYSYFKNKAMLFEAVIKPVYQLFFNGLTSEEARYTTGIATERMEEIGTIYLHQLLKHHQQFIILVDKSSGTNYADSKEKMVARLQEHISKGFERDSLKNYEPLLFRILANSYTENILEIARNYQNQEKAEQMLALVNQYYFHGSISLK